MRAQHLLDLLPGLGGQVQDPEISVVVELLPVGRGKLAPKDPELPPSRGHHSCLQDKGQLGHRAFQTRHTTAPGPNTQLQIPGNSSSSSLGLKEGESGLKCSVQLLQSWPRSWALPTSWGKLRVS